MTHGLLCATPEELDALRERLDVGSTPQVFGPTRVWTGVHGGREIALAQSGIGKVNAAAAATSPPERIFPIFSANRTDSEPDRM